MAQLEPRRKQPRRARERRMVRERRRDTLTTVRDQNVERLSDRLPTPLQNLRINTVLRDAFWYLRRNPLVWRVALGGLGAVFLLFVIANFFGGRIFPNVWALDVHLGGMTVDEAEVALNDYWLNRLRIALFVDGQQIGEATPTQLGIVLDARATAEHARGAGLAGMPLGFGVDPVIIFSEANYLAAQDYVLDLQAQVDFPPYNAGYTLNDGQVMGVAGREGRTMEVGATLDYLRSNPTGVVRSKRFDLFTSAVRPDYVDPEPHLEKVRALVSQRFELIGYDPFTDSYLQWSTDPETLVSWIEVDANGITLRQNAFEPFLDAQNASLDVQNTARYLDPIETMNAVREAISNQTPSVTLRIRYRSQNYTVQAGDTAFAIARKTGIPFYLIRDMNSGRNLDQLSPGDVLVLPSRDVTIQVDPIPSKRIIVDLREQQLIAYENGQEVFRWAISSGVSDAPTSPGIFQILTHQDIAFGSSYTLCSVEGCGQWKMYWFMGIYEVEPGLMNGFHGAVELPNGTYLGGGQVGTPYTFGCVMSRDDQAQQLYTWAEVGTIVEIVNSEFPPQSELARQALSGA